MGADALIAVLHDNRVPNPANSDPDHRKDVF